ncbi:hypothetical protein [Paenibacillus glacialis]|uniref:Uncharacterized protein n=1 Tax=Paenibacillus glacialis TaxID=494026 RepID=A0A162KE84_9BACL|nr:hypothetical protein [Paenibacillus glacialis]OAB45258.1 hypothetical protein PGLA_03085 [Paenibacillus glacialis]
MTSIGFDLHAREDFDSLVEYALTTGERITTKKGIYSYSQTGKGIELWLQSNKRNEIIGLNPHYSGSSKIKVGVTNELISESNSILDGSFHAWAGPIDESAESGSYPFVFDMPNRANYGEVLVPQILNIQLTTFAHELSVYDNEDEYYRSQDREIRFASESFIPSGLFENENFPSATAVITGRVIETSNITNEHTSVTFCWALVKTLGGEIDVVADKELVNRDIIPGGIISGSFWLSAKFLDNPLLKKKSIIERLFGR